MAGMTNPGSLLNFMDFRRLPGVGEFLNTHFGRALATPAIWDPSVLVVFATALATQLPLYQIFIKNRKEALLGGTIQTPPPRAIDLKLLSGAALFGAGWALAGFCPGPALTSAFAGAPNAATFLAMVLLGMFGSALMDANFDVNAYLTRGQATGLRGSLLGVGLLSAVVGAARYLMPAIELMTPVKVPHLTPIPPLKYALYGGALIGLSGTIYTLTIGRVMGLSGMLSGLFNPTTTPQERAERWTFLGGLAASALAARYLHPAAFITSAAPTPLWKVVLSGLMVGFGTACSNGCTSGHGLSGISRFAVRSIAATIAFFGSNVLVSTFLL
jgi:hypothetical protein